MLLAAFCAQNNVNIPDVGIPAAHKAMALSKDDPAAMDMLGWLLMLNGQDNDAEMILLRALDLAPDDDSVHFHLGVLYLQRNDRVSAYDHLVRARDLGSDQADAALKQYFP
jgi:Flp pilus assembly protein TadD